MFWGSCSDVCLALFNLSLPAPESHLAYEGERAKLAVAGSLSSTTFGTRPRIVSMIAADFKVENPRRLLGMWQDIDADFKESSLR
jgi:hypothetical protein